MRTALAIGAGLAALLFASRARAELPTPENSTGPEPPAPIEPPRFGNEARDVLTAADLDWSRIRHFERDEFRGAAFAGGPAIDLTPMIDARLIFALDELRELLGAPLIVSPVDGAVVRLDGDPASRHYGHQRLSDACDLFTPRASLDRCFEAAQRVSEIGGVGLYPHTRPHPLIHIDTRPRQGSRVASWARDQAGQYVAAAYALGRSVA